MLHWLTFLHKLILNFYQAINEERAKSYRQLEKRLAREKQLLVAQQKMEIKKIIQVTKYKEICVYLDFKNKMETIYRAEQEGAETHKDRPGYEGRPASVQMEGREEEMRSFLCKSALLWIDFRLFGPLIQFDKIQSISHPLFLLQLSFAGLFEILYLSL